MDAIHYYADHLANVVDSIRFSRTFKLPVCLPRDPDRSQSPTKIGGTSSIGPRQCRVQTIHTYSGFPSYTYITTSIYVFLHHTWKACKADGRNAMHSLTRSAIKCTGSCLFRHKHPSIARKRGRLKHRESTERTCLPKNC